MSSGEELHRQKPPDFRGIRKRHANAFEPWGEAEDAQLVKEVAEGLSVAEIARRHARPVGAIRSRIRQLDES